MASAFQGCAQAIRAHACRRLHVLRFGPRRCYVVLSFLVEYPRIRKGARRAGRARDTDRRIPRLPEPQPSRNRRPSSSFRPHEGAPSRTSSPFSDPARVRTQATPQSAASKFGPRRAVLQPCGEPRSAHLSARPAPSCAPPLRHVPWPVSTLRPTCRALSSPPLPPHAVPPLSDGRHGREPPRADAPRPLLKAWTNPVKVLLRVGVSSAFWLLRV